ncbi:MULTISPECIES: response regulator transcription factor [unclassified Rhizobium]|uniref:response regulator transcription factor n=1 Tax=unclassified Rhizobium TaxID=2613769 RepID=UPI00104BC801|nr:MULTISPECIES: response regulator transcription factor [unclassified Rhizobium]MBB3398363.1 DNA-binding response OmpR family regulator [Rhizobium sp. BK060]MBB4166869.1 DNA-binding response OmpR family regulator [Rhizobium sp. BK538]TCM67100.1 winged helix family two component transcriptional regulator [Rhizobium sp. BK068]
MRILLAEDDPNISGHVVEKLAREGYLVEVFASGPDVWEEGETGDYSAIILDLGLPGMDGLSILKRWRGAGINTPVLVLTARGSWMERVDGFDAGADDYLPKPFRTEELLARLRALLRRTGAVAARVKSANRFTLDESARRVTFDGRELDLSPLEYRMIALFIGKPGEVLSPTELASQVQGRDDDSAKNAVEAMVARLRKKTDSDAIETRRGFGYVLPERPR